jgi:membrane protein DedA with SNARE-associated domain
LVAGILEMPYGTFQIANFISAFVCVWSLLAIATLAQAFCNG